MSHTNPQIKQILKLNKKFYQSVAKDFSTSRNLPWKGWERAISIFLEYRDTNNENIKILDLGCGNGRFARFIQKRVGAFAYKGYDTNNDLLSEAKDKYKTDGKKKIKFVKKDIINGVGKIKSKYDLVVCFGITHHIPDAYSRAKWFTTLANLVDKRGCLVLTFWEFERKAGNYLISWDNKSIARYCHQYSNNELVKIQRLLINKGLHLLDEYYADNKNKYLIFGNI